MPVVNEISEKCGFDMAVVCPTQYAPINVPANVTVTDKIDDVISKTNVIYTDVWVSMGDEAESAQRLADFQSYQVTMDIMNQVTTASSYIVCRLISAKR